jgi:hypothetical protein
VTITARGQTFCSGVVSAAGESGDPLTDAEVYDKFRRYASPYLAAHEADDLLEQLERLEELADVSVIVQVCRREREGVRSPEIVPSGC